MKGLTRVDHEGKQMFGWLARAYGGGKTFSKYFSDRRYGGKEAARKEAVKYLEVLTKEVKEKFADYRRGESQPKYRTRPGSANSSGIVGIHRCETTSRGKPVKYWVATWNEDGRPKDRTFYFSDQPGRRGETEAKRLAIQFRAQKVLDLGHAGRNGKGFSDFKGERKQQPQLKSWVSGIAIKNWSPDISMNFDPTTRRIKKIEPFPVKRFEELCSFLGVICVLFDWDEIDYEYGRGVLAGDLRSRCFWNSRGIRTDVLIDGDGLLVLEQSAKPDPAYLKEKTRTIK